MEEQEIDYLQPTKFASIQKLGELWAHLEEECNEALVVAIPCVCMSSFGATASQKNDIAMELVDIQVMCNSIIKKLGQYPTLGADDFNTHKQMCGTLAMQIINLVECKAKAAMEYRSLIRGYNCYGEDLYHALVQLSNAAEALMVWVYAAKENRDEIRKMVYLKNERRGYYE